MTQQQQVITPYRQHQCALDHRREDERTKWRQRKLAPVDNLVGSWDERPLPCRLGIHRPVVWQRRLNYKLQSHIMPHCGSCGYEWYDYL